MESIDDDTPRDPHILILADGDVAQEFQLTGGPLDRQTGDRAVLADIGRAVLAWARMEQHLNLLIMTINRAHNSPALYDKRHPQAFSEQTKLAGLWFAGHPALVEWKEDFANLIDLLGELAEDRHTLAHGVLESMDTRKKVANFKSVKRSKKGGFAIHKKNISFSIFPRMTTAANAANTFLSVLTHKLCCPEGEEIMRWTDDQDSAV